LAASDAAFEACLAAAASDDGAPATLRLARERVENARQKERFLLKDLSSRPAKLVARADYPLVHLLERHADEYRGFEVRPATRRVIRARDADGAPIAGLLLGGVRGPSLREMVANEENVRKLRGGESAEDEEIGDIAAKILRADETLGSHGVEGYFDPELRGKNGWLETAGLDEGQSRGMLRAAIDGKDIVLTLDLDLQRAAQETLAHPTVPASEAQPDRGWLEHPVGAIVLLTPDGEVLAAASEPTRADPRPSPGRDLERTVPRERTLTKWPFTPPGSVFKPFVAAYAIDHLGLDPDTRTFSCAMLDDGGGGYKTIHCHIPPHGTTRLSLALAMSCNAAFGQIGEMYRPEDMLDMMEVFGFSAPTGIRQFRLPGDGSGPRRPGLTEHGALPYAEKLTGALRDERERRRFANGLGWIEATPMQIARALAGLVTGRLPEVRIAREIDGRPVEHVAHALGISARAREIICRDLEGVVETPSGTAWNKGLDRASLGFRFACKTGSADKREMSEELGGPDQMVKGQKKTIKQTWIAGWFPVEQPRAILVVMLHDVTETSTHTSVHLASQFLRTPAVQRFAAGLPPEEPGAGAEKRGDEAAAPRDDPSDGHAEPAAGAETAPGGVR
jgi:cell division protein FtsI/penicillin-binding protein 2